MFLTIYNCRERNKAFLSPCGSCFKEDKVIAIDEMSGVEYLKVVGRTNTHAQIQSYRESCDLKIILNQIDPSQVSGLMSTYSADDIMNASVIDTTQLPTSQGAMLNLVKKGTQLFEGLPIEVRREFNFSPSVFITKFGTSEFAEIMQKFVGSNLDPNDIKNNREMYQENTDKGVDHNE